MLTKEELQASVDAYTEHGTYRKAAAALGISNSAFSDRMKRAGELGLAGYEPVIPGFRVAQVSTGPNGTFTQQKPERGEKFQLPAGQMVKGVSALVNEDGREIVKWIKTDQDKEAQLSILRAALDGLKDDLPRAPSVVRPQHTHAALLNQYTITDLHMGMLAWGEETGGGDYDLKIAERLLEDWFDAAIAMAPASRVGVLAQIGDLLHHDSHDSVTPTSKHVLDADSRFQKMVRAALRVLRRVVARMLEKHDEVRLIMADANHDPASEVWLREVFAMFYENEPRVKVNTSAGTYYVEEHGKVSLFYHHGHKRNVANVDSVFAGRYRKVYGRTEFSYAHLGHLHSDELKTTNLMKVERHETLAAPDAYAANGGWLSGRSAKIITYHEDFGEVGRFTLTPAMVGGDSVDAMTRLMVAYGK